MPGARRGIILPRPERSSSTGARTDDANEWGNPSRPSVTSVARHSRKDPRIGRADMYPTASTSPFARHIDAVRLRSTRRRSDGTTPRRQSEALAARGTCARAGSGRQTGSPRPGHAEPTVRPILPRQPEDWRRCRLLDEDQVVNAGNTSTALADASRGRVAAHKGPALCWKRRQRARLLARRAAPTRGLA